ncbi:hypothetical protein NC99_04450 [Sunxiuqinia dokdonensis]|uniref:Uncharacterized protein n=1 Tax=Sunxiuqinia dokdonensis TaxID=1409788 RepID=A0A0L8VE48_9BACT|nr:hypothetical protein NC99_04450 [Sunxiuqinia dokdonensis]
MKLLYRYAKISERQITNVNRYNMQIKKVVIEQMPGDDHQSASVFEFSGQTSNLA